MKKNLKRSYVEETYQLLQESGYEGFTIRKAAERIGCSSSALYKHFADTEHLLTLASIRNLRNYTDDVVTVTNSTKSPLDICLDMWDRFLLYALPNAPAIEKFFFGTDSELFQKRLLEYYTMFPEDIADVNMFFTRLFMTGSFQEREFLILKKAVDYGELSLENADYLSRIDTFIFHGILRKYKDDYRNEEMCIKARAEMLDILRNLYDAYRIKSN